MEAGEELAIPPAPTIAVSRPSFLGLAALGALRHRDFRVLWLGMLLASSTIMFQYMAIGRLIETHFPRALGQSFPVLLMLGIAGLTRGAGVLISALMGGAFADRLNRRRLAIGTQLAALCVGGLFALLILLDAIQVWQVFVLLFAAAATQSFDLPARQAIIVEVVEPQDITNAVSLSTAALQTSFAIAPLLAGTALDTLGIGGAFALSLGGHVAVLSSLLLIHYRGRRLPASPSMLSHIAEGMGYARRHREVLTLLLVSFTVSAFAMGAIYNLSPYWVPRVLHGSPFQWGVVGAFWGLGYIVSGYGLSFARDFRYKGWIFLLGMFGSSLLLIAWGATRSLVWFSVVQFFMAATFNAAMIAAAAVIQNVAPNEVRGRLMSLLSLNPAFMMMNGIFIGAIAQGIGATTAVLVIGVALAGATGTAVVALPRLRQVH
ncbi:MAG: MFS transporter [Chloroflexi bacterium]|nr:MFS transporter [Chloroflexota bacterium]